MSMKNKRGDYESIYIFCIEYSMYCFSIIRKLRLSAFISVIQGPENIIP